ncbi:hypothetical protein CDAR_377941 [Caerostris darwini]|uniref:Uncharacterized protein n=1 Tax=Caerostris darwini TaxID=1538125 RepID=A0AAV4NG40_9ARAC|nr:hypothetical protein CDAR_377941 [Caerostris darwini]
MRDKLFKPDIFTFTAAFFLVTVIQNVCCRPKGGGRRGGSVALYGGRGMGRLYFTSARWAVLSPATKALILIFCIILGIFLVVGIYRAYVWCTKDPVRR